MILLLCLNVRGHIIANDETCSKKKGTINCIICTVHFFMT